MSTSKIVRVIPLVPANATPAASIDAARLSSDAFWTDHVSRSRPVVIRGGAASWPAIEKWRDFAYLAGTCGTADTVLLPTYNPIPFLAPRGWREMSLKEALSEIRRANETETLSIPALPAPRDSSWHDDLGSFSFLRGEKKPVGYPGRRFFIYRNASTEWHFHGCDETLTTQLVGRKHFSMFRLTAADWEDYAWPITANLHHQEDPHRFFPADVKLTSIECTLEPGDVLYIPPYWWHGVDPADGQPGVTMAHCFASPTRRFGSWSDPANTETMKTLLNDRLPKAVLRRALKVSLSDAARKVLGETW